MAQAPVQCGVTGCTEAAAMVNTPCGHPVCEACEEAAVAAAGTTGTALCYTCTMPVQRTTALVGSSIQRQPLLEALLRAVLTCGAVAADPPEPIIKRLEAAADGAIVAAAGGWCGPHAAWVLPSNPFRGPCPVREPPWVRAWDAWSSTWTATVAGGSHVPLEAAVARYLVGLTPPGAVVRALRERPQEVAGPEEAGFLLEALPPTWEVVCLLEPAAKRSAAVAVPWLRAAVRAPDVSPEEDVEALCRDMLRVHRRSVDVAVAACGCYESAPFLQPYLASHVRRAYAVGTLATAHPGDGVKLALALLQCRVALGDGGWERAGAQVAAAGDVRAFASMLKHCKAPGELHTLWRAAGASLAPLHPDMVRDALLDVHVPRCDVTWNGADPLVLAASVAPPSGWPKHVILQALGGLDVYRHSAVAAGQPVVADVVEQLLDALQTHEDVVDADGPVLQRLWVPVGVWLADKVGREHVWPNFCRRMLELCAQAASPAKDATFAVALLAWTDAVRLGAGEHATALLGRLGWQARPPLPGGVVDAFTAAFHASRGQLEHQGVLHHVVGPLTCCAGQGACPDPALRQLEWLMGCGRQCRDPAETLIADALLAHSSWCLLVPWDVSIMRLRQAGKLVQRMVRNASHGAACTAKGPRLIPRWIRVGLLTYPHPVATGWASRRDFGGTRHQKTGLKCIMHILGALGNVKAPGCAPLVAEATSLVTARVAKEVFMSDDPSTLVEVLITIGRAAPWCMEVVHRALGPIASQVRSTCEDMVASGVRARHARGMLEILDAMRPLLTPVPVP